MLDARFHLEIMTKSENKIHLWRQTEKTNCVKFECGWLDSRASTDSERAAQKKK